MNVHHEKKQHVICSENMFGSLFPIYRFQANPRNLCGKQRHCTATTPDVVGSIDSDSALNPPNQMACKEFENGGIRRGVRCVCVKSTLNLDTFKRRVSLGNGHGKNQD